MSSSPFLEYVRACIEKGGYVGEEWIEAPDSDHQAGGHGPVDSIRPMMIYVRVDEQDGLRRLASPVVGFRSNSWRRFRCTEAAEPIRNKAPPRPKALSVTKVAV
jgi:hypothetical protein